MEFDFIASKLTTTCCSMGFFCPFFFWCPIDRQLLTISPLKRLNCNTLSNANICKVGLQTPKKSTQIYYFKNLEILKIHDIFQLSIANFVYSTLTFESPPIFDDWFHYDHDIHNHTTRTGSEVISESYFGVGHVEHTYMRFTPWKQKIIMGRKWFIDTHNTMLSDS